MYVCVSQLELLQWCLMFSASVPAWDRELSLALLPLGRSVSYQVHLQEQLSDGWDSDPRVRTLAKNRGLAVVWPLNISNGASSGAAPAVQGLKPECCCSGEAACLIRMAPQWHPHRLRAWLKMLLLSICFLSTLTPHALFYSGTKTEGLNLSAAWILEAVSQITCCNRHLAKSLQRIITCIFKLMKAAEVNQAKVWRRSKINFQVTHSNRFLYHFLKVVSSDAQDKK